MVFVPHRLAYFTQHNALQFHPCCCKGYKLFLSLCCIEFHCVNIPSFLDPLICRWALRLLPVLGYCKLCCYEHWVHRFFWMGVSGFLGYNPSSRMVGSKGISVFSFLRKFHTVATVASPVCIPTNNVLGFPFLRILCNICLWISLCWPL